MIKFSNGYNLMFACGAGALGFDGRGYWWEKPLIWAKKLRPEAFTIVTKTLTLSPKKGNLCWWHPWTCCRLMDNGVVNSIGLTNPGIKKWCAEIYPRAKKYGYSIVPSIQPMNIAEAIIMMKMLPEDIPYVEINLSCPCVDNSQNDKTERILEEFSNYRRPYVVKLSDSQAHNTKFLNMLAKLDNKPEAIHAINCMPWNTFYDKDSPIKRYVGVNGGLSGPIIKIRALLAIDSIKQQCSIPIIGGGGISSVADILEFRRLGAQAFSIGSLFLTNPCTPNRLVDDLAYITGGQNHGQRKQR